MKFSPFPLLATLATVLLGASMNSGAQTSAPSSAPSQSASPTTSPSSDSQPYSANQGKDTSRGAKEQQSQKQPCPKNGDNSNVNCKQRNKESKPKQ